MLVKHSSMCLSYILKPIGHAPESVSPEDFFCGVIWCRYFSNTSPSVSLVGLAIAPRFPHSILFSISLAHCLALDFRLNVLVMVGVFYRRIRTCHLFCLFVIVAIFHSPWSMSGANGGKTDYKVNLIRLIQRVFCDYVAYPHGLRH